MYVWRVKTPSAYSSFWPVPVSPANVRRRSAYRARLARSAGHSCSTTGLGARVPWRLTICTATSVLSAGRGGFSSSSEEEPDFDWDRSVGEATDSGLEAASSFEECLDESDSDL